MDNFRRKGIIFVLLVIFACIGIVFYTVFHDDSGVVVPQLVGMNLTEASDALTKIGLTAKVDKVQSTEAENTVVTQDIKPGTKVKQGKSLVLQVSRGGKQVRMPDVRMMKANAAVQKLEQEGFKVTQTVRVEDSEKEPGTVLAQNPCGGQQAEAGCSVELLVCAGGASSEGMVYVPNLRGKTAEEAEILLAKNGLIVGEKTEISSSAKEGTVVSTKPGIGARVETGSAINLNIADGQAETKAVPEEEKVEKESTVKAVKTAEKPIVKKEDKKSKTETKSEKQQKEDAKKAAAKTETKKAVKEETKPAAKTETKAEAKQAAAKAETKQQSKTETKTAAKTETKQAEAVKPKEAETKAEAKTEAAAETKPAAAKSDLPEKSTRMRYVVPPLTKPMSLKITLRDAEGSHVLKDATVQGNEVISVPVRYKGKASLAISLGGETIWEESYK